MNTEHIFLMKNVERTPIILSAGASIFLGWNLFLNGVVKDQQAQFEKSDLKIILKKAAPGIFFSLFGTIVLLSGWFSPVDYTGRSSYLTKTGQTASGTPQSVAEANVGHRERRSS